MNMKKKIYLPPKRFISIQEAEMTYGLSDKTIRSRIRDEHVRARAKIDKTVRYDKYSLDEVLAGCITIAEVPLYKRFASANEAEALYGVGYGKLMEISNQCDAFFKVGRSNFYDTWLIDDYLSDIAYY